MYWKESFSVLWLKVILFLTFNYHTDNNSFKSYLLILACFVFISFLDLLCRMKILISQFSKLFGCLPNVTRNFQAYFNEV